MAQQGPPPPRSSRRSAPAHRTPWSADASPWESGDAEGEEYPPWAGPDIAPRWAGQQADRPARGGRTGTAERPASPPRRPRHTSPGFRTRFALARARRTRRYTYIWGGAAVAVAVVVAVTVLELTGHGTPKPAIPGLVTSYQPGEFKSAPDACQSVSAGTLTAYLPGGHRRMVAPEPLNGRAESQCNWTLDTPPVYRLLQVTVQVYPPSALASGNGSATANAKDAYAAALANKRRPPRTTHLPPATISLISHVTGGGFAALQQVSSHRATTDVMTVVVRDRNVLVTAVMQGFAGRGRFRAVPVSQLQAGATAAARDIMSRLH